jgi:hypothetical protein
MTNEQKIQKLKVFRDNGKVLLDPCLIDKDRLWKEMTEVFDMAIEALQLQQDCKAMDDSIDSISRQEALNIRFSDAINEDGVLYVPLRDFTDGLKALPSARHERKKGEWIPAFDGKFTGGAYWFSCSKCKRIVPEVRNGGWNFCPQCGADMRGE